MPLSSKTWSPSFSTVSKSNLYSSPEQPPLLTPTRKKVEASACLSVNRLSIYSFALDETVIIGYFFLYNNKTSPNCFLPAFEIGNSLGADPHRPASAKFRKIGGNSYFLPGMPHLRKFLPRMHGYRAMEG